MEALDQLRDRVRRAAALPRRGTEAVRQAGRSAIAVPRRAIDRLRPGPDSVESSAEPVEPSAFEDMVESIRDNPRVAVAIAGGTILVLAWIGWSIYVGSENGASAGLGVVIAWPALLVALALVSLPFVGGYLLIRRLASDQVGRETASPQPEGEGESETDSDDDDAEEGEDDDPSAEDDDPSPDSESDQDSESEAEPAAS